MWGWILAVALAGMAIGSVWTLRPLHPVTLWTLPWALSSGLYALKLLPYPALDARTALLILAATIAFGVGALGGEWLPGSVTSGSGSSDSPEREQLATYHAAVGCAAATGVVLVAFLAQVTAAHGLGAALVSSGNVRAALGRSLAPLTIKYVYLAIATAAIAGLGAAVQSDAPRRRRLLGLIAAAMVAVYFSTGRGTILLVGIVGGVAYFVVRGLPLGRFVALSVIAVVLAAGLIIALGTVIGKTFGNSAVSKSSNAFTARPEIAAFAQPYEYLSAPVASLPVEVARTSTWGRGDGCASLSPVCSGLKAAGLKVQPEPLIRPFTPPPIAWNTYTALDLPLIDGGFVFAVPIVFVLGLFCGTAWAYARRRRPGGVIVYAILASAIVFSSAQDNFGAPHILGGIAFALLALALSRAWQQAGRPLTAGRH